MRLPLVADKREVALPIEGEAIVLDVPSLVLVPLDEGATLAFASSFLEELGALGVVAEVVIESSPGGATSLPSALALHGARWSRSPSGDPRPVSDAPVQAAVVLFIGTGFAVRVRSTLTLGIAAISIPTLVSQALREVRARLDGILVDVRPGLTRRLAANFASRENGSLRSAVRGLSESGQAASNSGRSGPPGSP